MDTRDAGRKGGQAGRGEAKRRGDSAYYKALRAKRRCSAGCTFWRCGRERGHAGPCSPLSKDEREVGG